MLEINIIIIYYHFKILQLLAHSRKKGKKESHIKRYYKKSNKENNQGFTLTNLQCKFSFAL